jgi:hypothetical protein
MSNALETPASLLGRFSAFGGRAEPGELTLADGVLTFTPTASAAREPLFSVAVGQVRVRYPRRYFGMGLQLIVDSNRYRLWFLTVRSAAGETIGPAADKQTIVTGSTLNPKEFGPARAATRMRRGALSST